MLQLRVQLQVPQPFNTSISFSLPLAVTLAHDHSLPVFEQDVCLVH